MKSAIFSLPLFLGTVNANIWDVNWKSSPDPSSLTISTGDTVRFSFSAGHNVYKMADDTCNFAGATEVGTTSEVDYQADDAAGKLYFACKPHCSSGMKITVTVAEKPTPAPSEDPDYVPLPSTVNIKAYKATLEPLSAGADQPKGEVIVFATGDNSFKSVAMVGEFTGLAKDLENDKCVGDNSCGIHIHSGTSCATKDSQGAHYRQPMNAADPWLEVTYGSPYDGDKATNTEGMAAITTMVDIGTGLVAGKPVVLHNNGGDRIACGVLKVMDAGVSVAKLTAIGNSGVSGEVVTATTASGGVAVVGSGYNLEPNIQSYLGGGESKNCTEKNGCGAHVHSGTGCTDSTQGGHYFKLPEGSKDPWANAGYTYTNSLGKTDYVLGAMAGTPNVCGKPFILHNNGGGRVACGVLSHADKTDCPTSSPSSTSSPTANDDVDDDNNTASKTVALSTLATASSLLVASALTGR